MQTDDSKQPQTEDSEVLTAEDIAFAREILATGFGDVVDLVWAQYVLRSIGELPARVMRPDSDGGSADWPKRSNRLEQEHSNNGTQATADSGDQSDARESV